MAEHITFVWTDDYKVVNGFKDSNQHYSNFCSKYPYVWRTFSQSVVLVSIKYEFSLLTYAITDCLSGVSQMTLSEAIN